jgi:hypothetical protein
LRRGSDTEASQIDVVPLPSILLQQLARLPRQASS